MFQYRTTGGSKYTSALLTEIKQHCTETYLCIAGNDYDSIHALLSNSQKITNFVSAVYADIVAKDMTGVDLDFESQSSWTVADFTGFLSIVNQLGTLLHAINKKLQYSSNEYLPEENPDNFDFEALNNLPLDAITYRLWGRQWGNPAGYPLLPFWTMKQSLAHVQSKAQTYDVIPGINNYSYREVIGQNYPSGGESTFYNPTGYDDYSTRVRDGKSGEVQWTDGTYNYSGIDEAAMRLKDEYIRALGYNEVIVWSMRNDSFFF